MPARSLWRRVQAYDMKGMARESLLDCQDFAGAWLDLDSRRHPLAARSANPKLKQMSVAPMISKQMSVARLPNYPQYYKSYLLSYYKRASFFRGSPYVIIIGSELPELNLIPRPLTVSNLDTLPRDGRCSGACTRHRTSLGHVGLIESRLRLRDTIHEPYTGLL
jgi:hypothetical protein